jgi:hypothetical protein
MGGTARLQHSLTSLNLVSFLTVFEIAALLCSASRSEKLRQENSTWERRVYKPSIHLPDTDSENRGVAWLQRQEASLLPEGHLPATAPWRALSRTIIRLLLQFECHMPCVREISTSNSGPYGRTRVTRSDSYRRYRTVTYCTSVFRTGDIERY